MSSRPASSWVVNPHRFSMPVFVSHGPAATFGQRLYRGPVDTQK